MTGEPTVKIVFGLDGDETLPVVAITTPGSDVSKAVFLTVGPGFKYYVFASIPFDFSNGIVVNWVQAKICADTETGNTADIIAMLETPPLSMISAP